MANDNNNINELVSADDDPTAELEMPLFRENAAIGIERESDAHTFDVVEHAPATSARGRRVSDLESDLHSSNETINRLQFDIEQLHSKWLGLETEINARESQSEQLNGEIETLKEGLERKDRLIRKRDAKIRSLKKEIRQREEQHRELIGDFETLQQALQQADEKDDETRLVEDLAIAGLSNKELISKLQRNEEYADTMRQQLQDMIESTSLVESERDKVRMLLLDARHENEQLGHELRSAQDDKQQLGADLVSIEKRHREEIQILRFELGEAQDTMTESEQLNSQLTSDLVDERNFKQDLERMLANAEDQSKDQIDKLKKSVRKLTHEAENYEQKLNTKSEAITVLLAELAKKSEQLESIGDIEHVIHDIDDRITERIDTPARTPIERPTRMLVGTVDGQLLRFPLFKDRLSIGRTEDNDIQLKANYISRRHAVVQSDRDITRIIDWGSKNGVYVNSERVKEHFLEHGDIVTIGNARFRYEELKKRDA